jgi:hypothetical protein
MRYTPVWPACVFSKFRIPLQFWGSFISALNNTTSNFQMNINNDAILHKVSPIPPLSHWLLLCKFPHNSVHTTLKLQLTCVSSHAFSRSHCVQTGDSSFTISFLLNPNCQQVAWFQASAAVYMRSSLFSNVTQRRLVVCYRRFGTTYRPHLQGSSSQYSYVVHMWVQQSTLV